MAFLAIHDLNLMMRGHEGEAHILRGVDLSVERGEVWGIVGETGSGKSLTALSISRLVPRPPGRYAGGSIIFQGRDLLTLPEEEIRALRGRQIGMIFQDPTTNLNPAFTVGEQLVDVALAAARHDPAILGSARGSRRRAARALAAELLDRVGIANAARRLDDYPHQFSGGMRQRVLIALALIGRPSLLIADEPTTALDVSVQAQILRLFDRIVREDGLTLLFITHNLGIVAQLCSHVAVMNAGRIVESGPVDAIFARPQHAYTRALLAAVPSARKAPARAVGPAAKPAAGAGSILEADSVVKDYAMGGRRWFRPAPVMRALDGASLSIRRGECFGVVGESGSGKTTLTRCILRLEAVTSGRITFDGIDLAGLDREAMRRLRVRMQIVFQDPYASLNPRMSVRSVVSEPLVIHRPVLGLTPRQEEERVVELIERVRLRPEHLDRYPHEFSGGQRQRIGIARALACRPDLLLLDEPTSALDVSVQAQILELLSELRRELGLTYLFISHDLAVVRSICDRVMLLHRGKVVEEGETETIFRTPSSDYARMLIAAMPEPDPALSPYRAGRA